MENQKNDKVQVVEVKNSKGEFIILTIIGSVIGAVTIKAIDYIIESNKSSMQDNQEIKINKTIKKCFY